jgi:O-Antigen ligase
MTPYPQPWQAHPPSALPTQAATPHTKRRRHPAAKDRISLGLLAFMVAHIPLAFLMHRVPMLAKVHSLVLLAVGLWFALGRGNSFDVARLAAYMVSSEILWRMCGGGFFWEFGKYGFAVVLGAALCRKGSRAWDPAAIGLFVMLLPATLLTVFGSSLALARNYLSFYMSGPLALAVGLSFFARLRLNSLQLRSLMLAGIAPVLGAAVLCYGNTFGADDVAFGTSSNIAASGGFGPNQVSATLGYGIVAAALCLWLTPVSKLLRAMLLGAILLFTTQALLTLSRTGIWLAAITCVLAGIQLAKSPRQRLGLMLGALTVGLFCWLMVFPTVEKLSGGAVSKRFKETSGTGREGIAKADLQVWAHYPIFGVGPGMATAARTEFGIPRKGSHTEFTRLLSEHGLLGLISLSLLFYILLRAYRSMQTLENKVLAVAAVSFGLLFMSVAAMRLVLPAFMLGLACVRLENPLPQSRRRLFMQKWHSLAPQLSGFKPVPPGAAPARWQSVPLSRRP